MRILLVLAFVAVASAATIVPREELLAMSTRVQDYYKQIMDLGGEIEIFSNPDEGTVEVEPQFIVAWQVRRFVRKLQKQMPCGFPAYGIPPLAPWKLTEGSVHYQKGFVETFDDFYHLLLHGLDLFKVNSMKLSVFSSKLEFDFLFPTLDTVAEKYWTDTILDGLNKLGLSIQYEGSGTMAFGLKNLRITGVLKYKIPIVLGSIKITDLKTVVSLEKCTCDITGFMGDGNVNNMINRQIENAVEMGINNNQQAISDLIEEMMVPRVNEALKGKDFWTLLDYILSSSEGESENDPIVSDCVPPSDVWA